MKQTQDVKTVDFFEVVPKRGRGRPPSGSALSNADRQAAYRRKLVDQGQDKLTVVLDVAVLDALSKFIEFKDMSKSDVVNRILRDRLLRKR